MQEIKELYVGESTHNHVSVSSLGDRVSESSRQPLEEIVGSTVSNIGVRLAVQTFVIAGNPRRDDGKLHFGRTQ